MQSQIHYQGSHQEYDVICEKNVQIKMSDGCNMATDIYFPAIEGRIIEDKFPIILERTPYNKSLPNTVLNGKYFARRGYIVAFQDVRGRYESEGEWYPFAKEAPDGFETVEWLGSQKWSNGKVGTIGGSYCGSDQAALATLNPSHLSSMVVAVGASNYFHSSMRQNGALEQRFLVYIYRMAMTSKEALKDASLYESLRNSYENNMYEIVKHFPIKKGSTILKELPSYEQWVVDIASQGEYNDYWKQRGYAISEYYDEHADIPTLYWGGWYDSYARNTCESFMKLKKMKKSPQYLLMGPWTHGKYSESFSGELDFGIESVVDHNEMRLAWFDYWLKGMNSEVINWSPVRLFTMGTGSHLKERANGSSRIEYGGYWRNEKEWPTTDTVMTNYYLHDKLILKNSNTYEGEGSTEYTYDPLNPVPTIGGGISAADNVMPPGGFDQVGRKELVGCIDNQPLIMRADVLSFQTTELNKDTELTGPIFVHLWVSTSAKDTDFTAKLIDVFPRSSDYPEGLAINISDSIIRTRYRSSWEKPELMNPGEIVEVVFEMYPTSVIFAKSHKIRLDISSSNWPRFDVNHNTGKDLGLDRTFEIANQTIYHSSKYQSHIKLPIKTK